MGNSFMDVHQHLVTAYWSAFAFFPATSFKLVFVKGDGRVVNDRFDRRRITFTFLLPLRVRMVFPSPFPSSATFFSKRFRCFRFAHRWQFRTVA
tara:strand:+ start:173 stop:454 length:282 start_codon:yes stop_codon:yes gene_type:complete